MHLVPACLSVVLMSEAVLPAAHPVVSSAFCRANVVLFPCPSFPPNLSILYRELTLTGGKLSVGPRWEYS